MGKCMQGAPNVWSVEWASVVGRRWREGKLLVTYSPLVP